VFDEDKDENLTENRAVITGDILHSEPLVFRYNYTINTSRSYVFYGANDGMLHAVYDESYGLADLHRPGTEVWAFIPPDLLPRLKDLIETTSHQFYVDSSPKIYFKDVNNNGLIESGDQIILVCGERKGGSSYFALDITNPEAPVFLWRIGPSSTVSSTPDVTITELGQSWSEPQFGVVKTSASDTVGTPVLFIGGGYSENNSSGKAILLINVFTGAVVKMFKNADPLTSMNYSIPSSVTIVDWNDNGFIDKVYVGDTGGQLWRIGKFATSTSIALPFPDCDENIANWDAQVIFISDSSTYARKFFYPPALTLEKGYDLLFIGTGDRENACATTSSDRYYCIRDKQLAETYYEADLIDMTGWPALQPSLDTLSADVDANGRLDQGWFIRLATGEKVLSESLVYYKTTYFTTFVPYADPCVPGGYGYTYALDYKKAAAVLDFSGDGTKDPSVLVGGGIPSKVVPVITDYANKLLISIGSTNADSSSESFSAGVLGLDPLSPSLNFHYKWWREIFD
jgi:type IV pilus assembly protein PilY1